MNKLVYQYDSYLREYISVVKQVVDNKVVFEETIFHPKTGGVDNDTGLLIYGEVKYRVLNVYIDKETGFVIHELDSKPVFKQGDRVIQVIDWDRRYRLMRLHTAAHIISGLMYSRFNSLVTGGNISVDKAYDDYSLEVFDREIFVNIINEANRVVKENIDVKIYWLPREEALKIPGLIKLASRTPPQLEYLRIVEIPNIDIQADGGPHVRNTGEIGEIVLLDVVNKGKNKKRIYFTVKP
ncbi:MAG: alanyl-tRNA editing protein AlaXM [Desulfurococcaceae archaeon]